MAFSIQTNVASLQAQESLRTTSDFQARTINRLTSGYRINSSGDDAAGLAVANKFRSDVAELMQGVRNANDGVSQLQIVDGGLNNITKMLDRMKTLATQSASTTFTGDRDTLDNEFQALIGEITRQANNIGLSSGGGFNKMITVYTGGGSTQTNAQVSIDLSGSSNAVDATSLGLTGNIKGGGAVALGTLKTSPSDTFLTGGAQVFTFNIEGQSAPVAISVADTGTTGMTRDAALQQLNTKLASYGVTASFVDDTLSFTSSKAFSVTAAGASGTGAALATATTALNTNLYRIQGVAASSAATDQLTFTDANGKSAVVTLAADASTSAIVSDINTKLAAAGVTGIAAVLDATGGANGFAIESTSKFSVARSDTTLATNLGGAIGNTIGNKTVTGPSVNASTTSNALAAITAIATATAKLGTVQGVVGTGQNQLQYAINLAQSQVSSFSAAESRIRDADMAAEAANLTKAQVMSQASMAAMAQANSAPQAVLALLRG